MNSGIDNIVQELTSHESQLKIELNAITIERTKISDQLQQIQSALAALRGTSSTKLVKFAAPPTRKPVTSEIIAEAIVKILQERKSVPVSELLQRVKSQILAAGYSRAGIKPLFSKLLASSRFNIDQAQNVTLA